MNEIYWITRLEGISTFFGLSALFSAAIAIILFAIAIANKSDADIYDEGSKTWKQHINIYKKCSYWAKRCVIILIISSFINVFIPTTNEALLIYGVGGTIDYIKSNDTAKQLPDKCVKALDKYLNNLTKEENQKRNDNESK